MSESAQLGVIIVFLGGVLFGLGVSALIAHAARKP